MLLSPLLSFLRTVIDSARMRAVVTPECTLAIQQLAASFKQETLTLSKRFKGCWASWPQRLWYFSWACFTLQYWLKTLGPPHAWCHGHLHVKVNQPCVAALAPWKNLQWMERGMPLFMAYRRMVVSTEASNLGWGHCVAANGLSVSFGLGL